MADIDLDTLPLDELKKLQKDVNKAVDTYEGRRKQEARTALETQAREMGFSLSELADGTAKKGRAPQPAKYRHPENPSLTWSGRGRQPGWIKDAIENGTSIDAFLIDPEDLTFRRFAEGHDAQAGKPIPEMSLMSSSDEQSEVFPTRVTLRRIDPARKMRRFYLMQVQPDLFGGTSLIREWGRIGSGGQVLVEHHGDEGKAVTALLSMARRKTERGYKK